MVRTACHRFVLPTPLSRWPTHSWSQVQFPPVSDAACSMPVNLARESNGTIDFARIAAREDANGFAGIWNATTFAVCASTPPNLTAVSATTPPSSAGKSATVSCPAGTRVHSAGGQLTSVGSASVDGSLVIDRVAIDPQLRSVTVRAVEDETGTSAIWSVKALALCGP